MSAGLSKAERARLGAAYYATTYRFFSPAGPIDLRIGEFSPALAALLRDAGVDCWAIITAWNPGSRVQDVAANTAAQECLQDWLSGHGYRWLRGENLDEAGEWPVEATCFVVGIPEAAAVTCARLFQQNALVAGAGAIGSKLVWCCGGCHV